MTIAVDFGRKVNKQTNKQITCYVPNVAIDVITFPVNL